MALGKLDALPATRLMPEMKTPASFLAGVALYLIRADMKTIAVAILPTSIMSTIFIWMFS